MNHHRAKLTPEAVADIRSNYAPVQGRSSYHFAKKYGVSQPTILNVIRNATFKDCPSAEEIMITSAVNALSKTPNPDRLLRGGDAWTIFGLSDDS